jgi:RNA polymerase sigma-70 factor, ECF subfamily
MSEKLALHRAELSALAYRLLGSMSDADDMLQETFLRTSAVDWSRVENPRAFLMRTMTHLCLDQLKAARSRREVYPGTWLPEPVVGDTFASTHKTEHTLDLSYAVLLTLERLSPLERAAFVLHDVFDAGYTELATILERSEPTCRQLVARARTNLAELKARFTPTQDQINRFLTAFTQASQSGNPSLLEAVLCQDAVLYSDGGGKTKSALLPIRGGNRVARFFVGVTLKWPQNPVIGAQVTTINGQPGVILRRAAEDFPTVMSFEFDAHGNVMNIYSVRNPDKLRHVSIPTDEANTF